MSEGGSCAHGSGLADWRSSKTTAAVAEVPRNSRRVGIPYYTAMPLRRVGILSGTNPDAPDHAGMAAAQLGHLLADRGVSVRYEGAVLGPLSELLKAFESSPGAAQEAGPGELTAHTDALLALPGGPLGLEAVLGFCDTAAGETERPCGLLNTSNYFTELLQRGADEVVDRFVRESQRGRLIVSRDPEDLVRALEEFRSPESRRRNS